MYELGDLREGANREEIEQIIRKTLTMENIELYGIGSNLSCYGAIMPSKENMKELSDLVQHLETKFKIKFPIS